MLKKPEYVSHYSRSGAFIVKSEDIFSTSIVEIKQENVI